MKCPTSLGLLCLLAATPALADDPASVITTDTPAYCAQLTKQIGDRHSTIPDVQHLLAEGHDMCDRGEIRGGIRRLRHALVILHHRKPLKDSPAKDAAAKLAPPPKAAPPPNAAKPAVAAPVTPAPQP
jgi:hypothetical protein